jgi:hypothetical protein|tara:strand:- start:315 stop:1202 length:888 start_codon:yes stop_codon:yes gene_type:complete
LEIQIELADLRKKKIFVATPMYGGQCHGMYTKSSCDLAKIAQAYEMDIKMFYLFNESLITRARNYCVDEFLRSDYTHMMFIDSDIGFDPNDVLSLAILAEEGNRDIVCGPYPKKTIAWEKIKQAVEMGFANENPGLLENYGGDYVFNPLSDDKELRLDEPIPVLEGGTGFMMITKNAFKKFDEAYPELRYFPDHVRTAHFDGSRDIGMYFQALIDPESKRYLSEDYMFCQYMRKAGIKTYYCPWMKLSHTGSYVFGGSLLDLAQLGASATADPEQVAKMKKKKKEGIQLNLGEVK